MNRSKLVDDGGELSAYLDEHHDYSEDQEALGTLKRLTVGLKEEASKLRYSQKVTQSMKSCITKNVLSLHMAPDVVSETAYGKVSLGESEKEEDFTVLFADRQGFTALPGGIGAKTRANLLNDYLFMINEIISECGGIIDKFIGDDILWECAALRKPRLRAQRT